MTAYAYWRCTAHDTSEQDPLWHHGGPCSWHTKKSLLKPLHKRIGRALQLSLYQLSRR